MQTTSQSKVIKKSAVEKRIERKIRGVNEFMGLIESYGTSSIETPPLCPFAQTEDLFVHSYAPGQAQVWIQTSAGVWEKAHEGLKHPRLPNYRLLLLGGKARWVTRKTVATYKYRSRR